MPQHTGPDESNGLTSFSLHAHDEASSKQFSALHAEQPGHPAFALPGGETVADLDPETVARRYLQQALESTALPAFTAPRSDGRATDFTRLGTETVPLTGTRFVKFRQTLDRIPIYGTLVTVELDEDNELLSIDSSLGAPTGVDPVASVAPSDAVKAVAVHPGYRAQLDGVVPRLHYYFDAPRSRWRLVYILEDVPVSILRSGGRRRPSELEPPHFMDFVVDAHTAKVVAELPRTPSMAGVVQQAKDGLGMMRSMRVEKSGRSFVLRDSTYNVATFDFRFGDPTTNTAGLPGAAIRSPPAWSPAAVSAQANAVAVAEFMRTVLLRNNIDNRGSPMISSINCVVVAESDRPKEWLNAFWSPDLRQMVYGQAIDGDGLRSLSVNIDIVAHEMFHGVTDSTSRLEYARQPGALNESYSDIFGIIVSNLDRPDPRVWDWELGEGLLDGGRPFRDLANPARFGQPAHMNEFKVLPNTRRGDWGGVHVNSGIHNKAAQNMLVATSSRRLVFTPAEVAAVFYVALTQHLSRTSQFSDSRRAVVTSARTLFRRDPARTRNRKVQAIEKAFTAVGIV